MGLCGKNKNKNKQKRHKNKKNKNKKKKNPCLRELGVVARAFNPSFWEANTGGSLGIRGQPGLHSETYLNESKQRNWNVQLTSPDGSAVCSRECDHSLSLEWPSFYNRAPLSTLPQPSPSLEAAYARHKQSPGAQRKATAAPTQL